MAFSDWSTTAASNIAVGGISIAEGCDMANLNNAIRAVMADLAALALPPIGIIMDYAGTSAPSKWLFCYGQAVSRTTYATLFAVTGTAFGIGDGSTTFNLPDLRGRVIAGKDDMGGSAASRITNAVSGLTGSTLGAAGGNQLMHTHTHSVTDPGHTHNLSNSAGVRSDAGGGNEFSTGGGNGALAVTIASATTGISIQNAGSGSSQNVQPTLILNKIIYAAA